MMAGMLLSACQSDNEILSMSTSEDVNLCTSTTRTTSTSAFYVGADLSYTNELEDTGFFNENNKFSNIQC